MEGHNIGYRFKQRGDADYRTPTVTSVQGRDREAEALAGYESVTETLDIAGFLGVDYERSTLSKRNPDSANRHIRTGAEFSTEIDYHPIESLSVVMNGSYSTVSNFFLAQTSIGVAVAPSVFFGPEFTYQNSKSFHEWRVGTRLGPLELGALAISVTSGFARAQSNGKGAYGAIVISFRF